ncbi:hypothetical protein ColTof4_11739 [Colletotrichum tofieldiae]|nr:hypothetical protein ColTof3_03185 [Colletotrichum tofieldiae]GKT79316.1 hypothetical protein ColTof4_11739 [Colletotrichum tofieldiae]GKT82486.1 hypothetical protein Ct61P_00336 [Colletotrichum tofieldiae]
MRLPKHPNRLLCLPPDLRRRIYVFVFKDGSVITFNSFGRHDTITCVRKGQPENFYANDYCLFLLTCRQVYTEARAIYWAESIVRCSGDNANFGFLAKCLSDFAKVHVGHLRDIEWGLDSHLILAQFPRVKTVGIRWNWENLPPATYDDVTRDDRSIIAYLLKKFRGKPKDELGRGVQFLVSVRFSRGC